MPLSQLLELAKAGDVDRFETRCLELLERGELTLAQLVGSVEELDRAGQSARIATLVQMVFENSEPTDDAKSALALARLALIAAPDNGYLRDLTVELYRHLYGGRARFEVVLSASGLTAGRPIRMALKLLDLCLTLQPGDTLISRMDDKVVEVTAIDRENGLFTLRREGRTTTRPAPEVVREFDRVAADDFRVLRQLRPELLTRLIEDDPAALVIGLIHAHGEHIDADMLKHELVPRYVAAKEWSRWWTRTRNLLKRSPHVVIEGRSPIILSYCAAGQTLEAETWDTLEGQRDPVQWMTTIEGYLREKAARKEPADPDLLRRFHDHTLTYVAAVRLRRPAEALTCALVLGRLAERGLTLTDQAAGLAGELLRAAADAGGLLRAVEHEALRERGLVVLRELRPDDWVRCALACLPSASAGLLDKLATSAVEAGQRDAVQSFVDYGLADLVRHPELVYWLWKGPRSREVSRPSDDELLRMILNELSSLGRTVMVEAEVVKDFRHRMKAALSLRNYAKVRECLRRTSEAAAITIRRQLQRMEGLGENTPAAMLDILRDIHPRLWVVKPKTIRPWEDPDTLWCTTAGLTRRVAERDELVNVQMPENAKRIGEAASHGDLSENSEYKFALEERDLLRARLAAINDEVSRARPLEPHNVPNEHVGIGSRVTLRGVGDGSERVMTFLGPFETNVDLGILSYLAPVPQKLMGRRIGERVTVTFDGQDMEFEITALASTLE